MHYTSYKYITWFDTLYYIIYSLQYYAYKAVPNVQCKTLSVIIALVQNNNIIYVYYNMLFYYLCVPN